MNQESIEEQKEPNENLDLEKEEYLNQLQRLQAEFINYRNRINQEKELWIHLGKEEILRKFLVIKDNFERAPKMDEGITMIYKQLNKIFEDEGIKEISTETFDPEKHEVIANDSNGEEGKVVTVCEKGYLYHDHILRPARVVIGTKKQEENEHGKDNRD